MLARIMVMGGAASLATPAYAGTVVPTAEAGMGLAAMALLGVGYAVLRRRSGRS